MQFNADRNFPAPGFRLGLPILQPRYYNAQTGTYAYMMITSAGARVEMRQQGTTSVYESADSNYVQLTDNGTAGAIVRTTDGTQLTFVRTFGGATFPNGEYRCTQIKDHNGNYLSASYDSRGHITGIRHLGYRPLDDLVLESQR